MDIHKATFCIITLFTCTHISFGQNKIDSLCCISKDSICCSKKDYKEPVFESPEVLPKFLEDEMSYMRKNFKIPQETIDAGMVSGRLVVSFIVEKDGSISDVRILLSSFDENFNKKYMSVIKKMPKWKPGLHKGKAVRTKVVWPISYDFR